MRASCSNSCKCVVASRYVEGKGSLVLKFGDTRSGGLASRDTATMLTVERTYGGVLCAMTGDKCCTSNGPTTNVDGVAGLFMAMSMVLTILLVTTSTVIVMHFEGGEGGMSGTRTWCVGL